MEFQKGEEDKGEKDGEDSAADDEVKAIEDNANGTGGEEGVEDNNNGSTFDLGHQQQQESSTPTPDARSGTAGSRKLQPASMQPTVMEVRMERTKGCLLVSVGIEYALVQCTV